MNLKNNGEKLMLTYNHIEVGYLKYQEDEMSLTIDQLYVYPGFRKNGYAKVICENFIEYAKAKQKSITTECWYFIEMFS